MFDFNAPESTVNSSDILQENYITVRSVGISTGNNVQYLRGLLRNGKLSGAPVSLEKFIVISDSRDNRDCGLIIIAGVICIFETTPAKR